eukprot:COSAG01_NODE_3735_length_5748_cov_33.771464_2_plen_437_part_00
MASSSDSSSGDSSGPSDEEPAKSTVLSRRDVHGWFEEQRKAALAAVGEVASFVPRNDDDDDAVVLLDASKKGLEDISVLSSYRALGKLDLSHNRLRGLGSVAELGASLRSLSLAHNPLASADGVERLGLLTTLDFCYCGLRTLPPLDGLPALLTLLLSGNTLTALPVVAAAGVGDGEEEQGLRELRIDRNQLASVGAAADWMAARGRQLRVLEFGAKFPAQKKNQKNTGWSAQSSAGDMNPLTPEAIAALLRAVAGCCHKLEVLSIPSAGAAAGRLSREERKKRATARKKGATAAGAGGDVRVEGMMLLHALPKLTIVNGYDWVRNLAVVTAAAEAAVRGAEGADEAKEREKKRKEGKRRREDEGACVPPPPSAALGAEVKTEAEAAARKKKRKKAKKQKKAKVAAEEDAAAVAADRKAKRKAKKKVKKEKLLFVE